MCAMGGPVYVLLVTLYMYAMGGHVYVCYGWPCICMLWVALYMYAMGGPVCTIFILYFENLLMLGFFFVFNSFHHAKLYRGIELA